MTLTVSSLRPFVLGALFSLGVLGASATTSSAQNTYFEQILGSSQIEAGSVDQNARRAKPNRAQTLAGIARAAAAERQKADNNDAEDRRSASLSGGGITWHASASCVPSSLRGVLGDLVGQFGPVTVSSTCRSRSQNRAAGGADSSYHLSGEAVDFRVQGDIGAVYAYLSKNDVVGGLKHYGGGLFHIDTGPRRSW